MLAQVILNLASLTDNRPALAVATAEASATATVSVASRSLLRVRIDIPPIGLVRIPLRRPYAGGRCSRLSRRHERAQGRAHANAVTPAHNDVPT